MLKKKGTDMKMKKSFLRILAFSVITLIGVLLIGCAGRKDFTPYTKDYETTVTAVNLMLDVSEIEVKKSDGDKITLHYYDTAENFYNVKEENGVLSVSRSNLGELQENIRFGLGMKKYYKVTLSLPDGYAGELTLQTTSGDVVLKGISSEKVKIKVKSESGDVKADSVSVSALDIDGKTSEIILKKTNANDVSVVTVAGEVITSDSECAQYTVKGEAAEVELKNVSIGEVSVTLTTGDTELVNVKIGSSIHVSSTAGDISADGLDASNCTVTSKNGDIYLENLWIGSNAYLISEDGDIEAYISDPVIGFTIDSVSEYGKNNLAGTSGFGGFKKLTVRNVTGDINIKFS